MSAMALDGVSVERAGMTIVRELSFELEAGQVTALFGANGAGKTTLLEGISGMIPSTGAIDLDGRRIDRVSCFRRAKAGLGHVEQGRPIFPGLTVRGNLEAVQADSSAIAEALALFPELEPRYGVAAGSLSGGEQQMVVMARALACRPSVLMVDEMSLGLAPAIVHRMLRTIREIADGHGTAVLLVEQYAALALRIADAAHVLARGEIVFSGTAEALGENPELLEGAYLATGDTGRTPAELNKPSAGGRPERGV